MKARRQAIASNIDTALLVMGLDHDFNPASAGTLSGTGAVSVGVAPVVVLTKADIGADVEDRLEALRQRLPSTIPVVAVNGLQAQAADLLAPWLAPGQTLILLGSSGAKQIHADQYPDRQRPGHRRRARWRQPGPPHDHRAFAPPVPGRRLHHRYARPAQPAARCGRRCIGGHLRRHRGAGSQLPVPRLQPWRRTRMRRARRGRSGPHPQLPQAAARSTARTADGA
ncbi:GTPase RsgA [Massilia sp. H-1]|nr:GTPase RsgA [Massilia sp. H-1]